MADSPFIKGTFVQYAWDSTSLGWLKECPRKYYYSMIMGYRSKGESVHLKFGIIYHSALELYDKLRAEPQGALVHDLAVREVVRYCLKETWNKESVNETTGEVIAAHAWLSDHNTKTRETLIRTVIWYLEQFKDDPAQTLILANGRPAVELSFKMPIEEPYILSGHLDRVVELAGNRYVSDRKTTGSTISSYYYDQYEPDNQMSLYSLAARVVFDTPVSGVMIDAAQIAVGFSRFGRGFTYRTPGQVDEWLADTRDFFRQAEGYAERKHWPMNDKSCHKFGGCPFRKVCSKDAAVRQTFLESDYVVNHWNPLQVR